MKKLAFLIILLAVQGQSSRAQSLRFCNGNFLLYQSKSEVLVVKKLEVGEYLQGYDPVDSNRIFFAYCIDDDGIPATLLKSFNLATGQEQTLARLGSTGDSWFTYSRENGLVLLTWSNGIYTWDCLTQKGTKPKRVLSLPSGCVFPFWVNSSTFGYTICGRNDRRPVIVHLH